VSPNNLEGTNKVDSMNSTSIPVGSVLVLAQNLSLPWGEEGTLLAQRLQDKSVTCVPGQILTFGGALTLRLEWFWRVSNSGIPFDKPLAH
jgi:hypothetical protein